jgi:glycine oxidase
MLAAQIEPADDAGLLLAVHGRELTAALAARLEDTTGIDLGLRREGIAALALGEEDATRLRVESGRQRRLGARAEWLDGLQAVERWPGLTTRCRGALYSPEGGAVDPERLTRALLGDAARHGAIVDRERGIGLLIRGNRIEGVRTAAGTVTARHTIIAAGAWSPMIEGLPRPLPVEPVRGQLAALPWPAPLPRVILYHQHCYILPRGTEAILGSTMERGVGFQASTTNEAIAGIVRSAAEMVPTLANGNVLRRWAGLRPLTPDGLPIVGPDPAFEGLWYATGHGRNGVLLAALTGEIIATLLTGGTPAVDVSPWSVARFAA